MSGEESAAPAAGVGRFSFADFRARAARRLSLSPPPVIDPAVSLEVRAAAVLVPVVAHADEATVLLTRRADALRQHSGQIAFPGGKIDPGDASPLHAALREAEEEIGLDPASVELLGYLDPHLTGTGYRVLPVLATLRPPVILALNPKEVDEAFEVPLAFLMVAANHRRLEREWKGQMRQYYAMPYEDRYIWGITAGILRNLYERLYT